MNISQHFEHLQCRVMSHSCGHEVLSDWADKSDDDPVFGLYKKCGFIGEQEADILRRCAAQFPGGRFLDIGAHTGWSSLHMALTPAAEVIAVENMFDNAEFIYRFDCNISRAMLDHPHIRIVPFSGRSEEYHKQWETLTVRPRFDGVFIDGDHGAPNPLDDANRAHAMLKTSGFIGFHDAIGGPVHDGVSYLLNRGFKAKLYWTSAALMVICWRGTFAPPDYTPDAKLSVLLQPWMVPPSSEPGFPFERCE
jgi:predicted O-methyltransferase YrrM